MDGVEVCYVLFYVLTVSIRRYVATASGYGLGVEGASHTLLLRSDGEVLGLGANNFKQLKATADCCDVY